MAAIGAGWADGAWVQAGWAANAWAQGATAAISGTASSGLTESQVVAGGETIIITLTNDTWVQSIGDGWADGSWIEGAWVDGAWVGGGAFNAVRQGIIDGLDSAQAEATGWNTEVRDKEVVGSVVRTSDTVVTITLTAAAAYNITANETITVTIPASALVSSVIEIVASPTVGVTADAVATTPTVTSTGGWAFLNAYDGYRQVRRRRKRERERILEEIREIDDKIDREIAELIQKDVSNEAREAELSELELLVADTFSNRQVEEARAYSAKVAKAYIRALQQGNFSALQAFEREMERAREEDDFLFLALLLLE